jgi:hypothetical protein
VSTRSAAVAVSAIVVAFIAGMLAMGRLPWCACGYVKIWHGVVKSSENSQHLFDWYTFTHLLHGFGLYALLHLIARGRAPSSRLVAAIAIEAAWEIFENTPWVIERYRAGTISLDYYGDTIVNSLGDILASTAGFLFAARAPVWATLAAFAVVEVGLALVIRDNLTLNVLMLIWPIEAIRQWQLGG